MRIIKGSVSVIVLFEKSCLCRVFYDIDETVLGIGLPLPIKHILYRAVLLLPHRVVLVTERLFIPLKVRIDRVILYPLSKCFITARTTNSIVITIEELAKYFDGINIVVFRRTDVRISDYYRFVLHDISSLLGVKPRLIVLG